MLPNHDPHTASQIMVTITPFIVILSPEGTKNLGQYRQRERDALVGHPSLQCNEKKVRTNYAFT